MGLQLKRATIALLSVVIGCGAALSFTATIASNPDPYTFTEFPGQPLGNKNAAGLTPGSTVIPSTWAVIVTQGQSLIASNSLGTYSVVNTTKVFMLNVYDGGIYPCANPVLGASIATTLGSNSPNCQIADSLVGNGTFPGAVVVPIAIDGTSVANWNGAQLSSKITATWNRLVALGLTTSNPLYILWHQGEQDAGLGTSSAAYTSGVQSVVTQWRNLGFTGPFFVPQSETVVSNLPNSTIATGQANAISTPLHIVAGANWDSLVGATYRQSDGTHPTASGAAAMAGLDVAVIHACVLASC